MLETVAPKYPAEFVLEFVNVDRFLYRVSDLYEMKDLVDQELLNRLDNCHIYLLAKRPRVSLVPQSIQTSPNSVQFIVQYKDNGAIHQAAVEVPRHLFGPEEVHFEASPYPHRDLVSRNANGNVVAETLLANYVTFMPNLEQNAKDLEVVYVGKGLRRSANDRLLHHATLQEILARIHSNEPDGEVFALVYAFRYKKIPFLCAGIPAKITGEPAKARRQKVQDYKPSIDEQVSLIEASLISYFRPEFNHQYLDFPDQEHLILKQVRDADFAGIVVGLDNTTIGDQRIYSRKISPKSVHAAVVDFRRLEGEFSLLPKRED